MIRTALLLLLGSGLTVLADVQLPKIFGPNMVLQRNQPLPIWGTASPGEIVTVTLLSGGRTVQEEKTFASEAGEWKVRLKPIRTGPEYELVIRGKNLIRLGGIEAGEVWLASGQSNMHWTLHPDHNVFDHAREVAAANYPKIRFFTVEKKGAPEPQKDLGGAWLVCTPKNLLEGKVNGMSAVGYFFAREIHQSLNVPVAIVNASVGGTAIELWSPQGHLYHAMIHPLGQFAIRGALWYQGESNCINLDRGAYAGKQKAMIESWRRQWGQGDFPFLYVQLAPFKYEKVKAGFSPEELPIIWEAQADCLKIPNTGMAVITDLVDNLEDIHPRDKKTVGLRLASIALGKVYGRDSVVSGPMFSGMSVRDGVAVISFAGAKKLSTRDGREPDHFMIAGKDKQFVPARAVIRGNRVEVSNPQVREPAAVRFGWNELAQPNLVNEAGWPASPFRTDRE